VAAVRIGAVPEIVDEGVTGFTADSIDRLPECVTNACSLDRSAIRARAEKRFSSRRMGEDYVRLYQRILRNHT
jgi:glycosyltransferase involved in cell wall biosynthesis